MTSYRRPIAIRVNEPSKRVSRRRAEIERRFASKKLGVEIERFELNPEKSDMIGFLNEHALE
jgi:hypothetical protein